MKHVEEKMRGQIWMVEEPQELSQAKINTGDKSLAYRRACLIVESDDSLKAGGPLIAVLPINGSMSKDDVIEEYIPYQNGLGDYSRIIISQPSVKMRGMFSKYLGTLDQDVMADVDAALVKHLGLGRKTSIMNVFNRKK